MEKKSTNINWYPGHMAKARREIEERVKLVDLIIELRDARAPLSTSNPIIGKLEKTKPHLIILTKKDMADDVKTAKWIECFKERNTTAIALDLTKFNAYGSIVSLSQDLLKEKMEKERQKGLKPRPVRALVVGIPNVGKSTFINRLAKRKATITGDRPGVTKSQQIIKISKDFELFDTPGILWPKFEDHDVACHIALVGSIKNTILPMDELFIYAVNYLVRAYPGIIEERYGLSINLEDDSWIEKFFLDMSRIKGIRYVRGEIDYDRIIDLFFNDLIKGYFGKITWQDSEDANQD